MLVLANSLVLSDGQIELWKSEEGSHMKDQYEVYIGHNKHGVVVLKVRYVCSV
jgi:hypothetical protein